MHWDIGANFQASISNVFFYLSFRHPREGSGSLEETPAFFFFSWLFYILRLFFFILLRGVYMV